MDPIETPVVDAAPAAEPTTTTPPSPAPDAAERANTAPAQSSAREAFERLAKGESPDAVNKALYREPASRGTDQAKPAGTPAGQQQDRGRGTDASQPTGEPQAPEGVTPEDLQVLRRAKFDMAAWKHIPPSNRAAIVRTLKTSQAEADRQFQQARAGKPPQTPATPQAQQPGRQDEATPREPDEQQLEVDAQQQQRQPVPQKAAPVAQQQQPAEQAFNPLGNVNIDALVDPQDLETLRTLGGDDLAETHKRGIARAVGFMQQQMAPLQAQLGFMLSHFETQEFDAAVQDLSKQPGLENLTADQKSALREKASLLIRAAGDLQNYRFKEAVQDAAASLFKTDVQTAAQARLLKSRQASLRSTPERGVGRLEGDRPLTGKDRDRAIFAKLQEGFSPDEARRAIDSR